MFHKVESEALVMNSRDHVATALKVMEAGQIVRYMVDGEMRELKLIDPIPFGHKFAICGLDEGQNVRKYGETIGKSTSRILAGQHVHVHNIEGIRGRGDQAGRKSAE